MITSISKTTGCMDISPHWPWVTLTWLQLSKILQIKQSVCMHTSKYTSYYNLQSNIFVHELYSYNYANQVPVTWICITYFFVFLLCNTLQWNCINLLRDLFGWIYVTYSHAQKCHFMVVIDNYYSTVIIIILYHSVQVDEVEITDSAIFWLFPSKEDSSMVANTCQCEVWTGRRSSSSDGRGEPDTCRRLCIDQYLHTYLHVHPCVEKLKVYICNSKYCFWQQSKCRP